MIRYTPPTQARPVTRLPQDPLLLAIGISYVLALAIPLAASIPEVPADLHEAAVQTIKMAENVTSLAVRDGHDAKPVDFPSADDIRSMTPAQVTALAWIVHDSLEQLDPSHGTELPYMYSLGLLLRRETLTAETLNRFRDQLREPQEELAILDALNEEASALRERREEAAFHEIQAKARFQKIRLTQRQMALGRHGDSGDVRLLLPYLEAADESIAHWARWAILDLLAKRDGRAERALLTGDEAAHTLEEAYADEIERARRATRRGEESSDESGL